jgi:hypothetical protein
MNQQDKEDGSPSSKRVYFSDVVEEIYADDSTTYLYEDDTEMDLIELSNDPTAYRFGVGLQAFRDLSEYEDLFDESSASEESVFESGGRQQISRAIEEEDEDDFLGKGAENPPRDFLKGCVQALTILCWCSRGLSMLGNVFTPSPIEEDDVTAAVGTAKGGKLTTLAAHEASGSFTSSTGGVFVP